MHELLMELLKAIVVVTAVLWIPCGIIGIGQVVRFLIRERRWWKAAKEEAFDDEDGEVVYR